MESLKYCLWTRSRNLGLLTVFYFLQLLFLLNFLFEFIIFAFELLDLLAVNAFLFFLSILTRAELFPDNIAFLFLSLLENLLFLFTQIATDIIPPNPREFTYIIIIDRINTEFLLHLILTLFQSTQWSILYLGIYFLHSTSESTYCGFDRPCPLLLYHHYNSVKKHPKE